MAEEPRGLAIVGTDMKIGDEDLVKLGVSRYGMQVLARERHIQKLIKDTSEQVQKLQKELDEMVKDPGVYKDRAKELAALLAKPLGIHKVTSADTSTDYREKSKGVDGCVGVHIHIHWKDGSLTHAYTRKLTKKEKDTIRAIEAGLEYTKKLQESLLEIKAIQGRYPMLADYIRGNVTEAKLAKLAPELLKTVEINLPEFDLPAMPKPAINILPAPK